MYTPNASLHITPEDTDLARTLALRLYDDDAIIALDFDDTGNPYVISHEDVVICLGNRTDDKGNTIGVSWTMYANPFNFANRNPALDSGAFYYTDIYDDGDPNTITDIYELASIELLALV